MKTYVMLAPGFEIAEATVPIDIMRRAGIDVQILKDVDEFKAPSLKFDEKREYKELANKKFKTADPKYDEGEIQQAIQTIQFELNEKGGKVKSEAAIDMTMCATSEGAEPKKDEPRYFYVDDTFTIFLREKGKDKPYFAGRVDDITKFQ